MKRTAGDLQCSRIQQAQLHHLFARRNGSRGDKGPWANERHKAARGETGGQQHSSQLKGRYGDGVGDRDMGTEGGRSHGGLQGRRCWPSMMGSMSARAI